MNQETCKYLTEEVLKRCWHDWSFSTGRRDNYAKCKHCGTGYKDSNLTFTTANDIKLLTDKMKEDGDEPKGLTEFEGYLDDMWQDAGLLTFWWRCSCQEQAQLIADFYREQR